MNNWWIMTELPYRSDTEVQAEQALETSYRMVAPLGVPTLIIDPGLYNPALPISPCRPGETIETCLKRQLTNVLHNFYGDDHHDVSRFLDHPGSFWMDLVNKLEYCINTSQMVAHSLAKAKLFNVVICPRTNDTGTMLVHHGLNVPREHIPDIPGTDIQWNFIKLWHEFGHGLKGPGEASADWVSALVHQYVFSDATPLMVLSDFRAVQAMLHYDRDVSLQQRGWALVETLDHALTQGAPANWDDVLLQIENCPIVETHAADIRQLGQSFRSVSRLAYEEPDLLMLGMMSDQIAYKGNVDNEAQLRIAHRFAIAAQRLSLGRPAYAASGPLHRLTIHP